MILSLLFAIEICWPCIQLAFSGCYLHVTMQIRTLKSETHFTISFCYNGHYTDAVLFWCGVKEQQVEMGNKKFKESSQKSIQIRFINEFIDTFLDSSKDGVQGKVCTSPISQLLTEGEFCENIYSSIIFRISYFCFFGSQAIDIFLRTPDCSLRIF